jgi:hypothetical protein
MDHHTRHVQPKEMTTTAPVVAHSGRWILERNECRRECCHHYYSEVKVVTTGMPGPRPTCPTLTGWRRSEAQHMTRIPYILFRQGAMAWNDPERSLFYRPQPCACVLSSPGRNEAEKYTVPQFHEPMRVCLSRSNSFCTGYLRAHGHSLDGTSFLRSARCRELMC